MNFKSFILFKRGIVILDIIVSLYQFLSLDKFDYYVNECTFAERQLCKTKTTGLGQHSMSSS